MLTIESLRLFGANGVTANLALRPICEPVSELTEKLRAGTPGDYRPDARSILALRDELKAPDKKSIPPSPVADCRGQERRGEKP